MAICEHCDGEMLTVTGCTHRTYKINGSEYGPIPAHGHERECHDCGAMNGQFHHIGCDTEKCPVCSGQLISCPHADEVFNK